MKRLLVIGGTGFIGYHIIKEAKKRKWKITSISLKKPKKKRFHKKVKYKKIDIRKFNLLKKKITEDFDFVVNAGGYGNNPDFGNTGKKLFKSHLIGVTNLVKFFSKKKIKKFIQIGSSAEYGNAISPQSEDSSCSPQTPYALAKFSCTNFLQSICRAIGFPVTILRLFLVYGPSQDKNRILPQIISNCLINKKFPVTKGEQYCDFCFIDDVVNGVFKSFSSSKTNGEILNIGSGKPIRIKNIVNLVCKLIGKGKPQYGKLKYKKGINMELFPNIKKAKLKIGWFPKVTLAKGLSLTIKSYR